MDSYVLIPAPHQTFNNNNHRKKEKWRNGEESLNLSFNVQIIFLKITTKKKIVEVKK